MIWLITGAAGTLGSALARRLARENNELVLLDRNLKGLEALADEIERDTGRQPMLMPLDLAGAGPADFDDLASRLEAACGRLDVLMHAAADFQAPQPLEHTEPLDWFKTVQAGLTGPFLLSRALLPLLRRSRESCMVFIVDSPVTRPAAFWGAYGVTQPAREALARTWRQEIGDRSPRVISVDPGAFRGPLRKTVWPMEDDCGLPSPDEAAKRVVAAITGE